MMATDPPKIPRRMNSSSFSTKVRYAPHMMVFFSLSLSFGALLCPTKHFQNWCT
ncbi:hypothetical protein BRADI_5g10132v3 [Brachypodium distachyon]|uniref:Uncharacterized protein n=1 Tax=Brachypodium distachyon TaxID=15368 RepID=A0A2K2CGC8_BRADI|nr:hypothetical protein BRADI_5g10132v3 [Brachypodium distachyon]